MRLFLAAMSSSRSDIVTLKFLGCFKKITRIFQGCLKEVLWKYGNFKGVSKKFRGVFKEVSRVFKDVSRKFQWYFILIRGRGYDISPTRLK